MAPSTTGPSLLGELRQHAVHEAARVVGRELLRELDRLVMITARRACRAVQQLEGRPPAAGRGRWRACARPSSRRATAPMRASSCASSSPTPCTRSAANGSGATGSAATTRAARSSFVSASYSSASARSRASRRRSTADRRIAHARVRYSPVRVSTLTVAGVHEQRHLHDDAGLERRRLAGARHPVALDAGLGLGDGELDRGGQVDADDLVLVHLQHRR